MHLSSNRVYDGVYFADVLTFCIICTFREKWTSIVFHITNVHQWDTAVKYHQCSHDPLTREEQGEKLWLKPGSSAHELLKSIVFDPKILKALEKLTLFCHTGPLEVAHSLYLKYCPKRQHFSYKGEDVFTINILKQSTK